MKYMGSKRRIAKHILPIILHNRTDQVYVEPFVGGGNMIEHVANPRIASDVNPFVISALSIIKNYPEKLPKTLTEKEYQEYKRKSKSYNLSFFEHSMVGYVGFALSYAGKWFGGYCRDGAGKRDYIMEAYRNAQKQSKHLQDIVFYNYSYEEVPIPPRSIIYCDPPYADTTNYSTSDFNHERFWKWCRNMAGDGHQIFVSEYSAPTDFTCVWSKPIATSLTADTGSKQATECLFTI